MARNSIVVDYVSGRPISDSPEEIEAVQPFSLQLVEDYLYPKSHLQTRPQWRVKKSPSDTSKAYPIDIAVFSSEKHTDENLYMVVECKKKTRNDGFDQLKTYLALSHAKIGVWTNGKERLFIRKVLTEDGAVFVEIPNIPIFGQKISDVGLFKRSDLRPTHNLKSVFKSIRNYLAANAVGITRDEVLAREIINLIFCKIYDEKYTRADRTVEFRAGIEDSPASIAARIKTRFEEVKETYSDVFDKSDSIGLDDLSLAYVVGELQQYSLMECKRDVVADAFETFIGPSLKGAQGQFFTPRNVTCLIRELVGLTRYDSVVDPACGSGGFLIEALRGQWAELDNVAEELGWPAETLEADKQKAAIKNLRGIDKDEFLSKVAKAYMAIMGDGRGGVYCENSLANQESWESKARDDIPLNHFSVIMTNPPFGKSMKVTEESLLKEYDLGHVWKRTDNGFEKCDDKVQKGVPPQILFVERCLQLLKEDGRCGIVLPESLLCNPSHRHIVKWLEQKAEIEAVISFHEDLFQPYTHAKAAVVLFRKKPIEKESSTLFMAMARWCGHDSRGNEIEKDDIPLIIDRWRKFARGEKLDFDSLGFSLPRDEIRDSIYLPKLYDPEISRRLADLEQTHSLIKLGDLVRNGVVEVSTGDEVNRLSYGTGSIPFVRTSDIANWQIKPDPKHGLSEEVYAKYKDKQNIEAEDILMVRDGSYLVGTCAMVTNAERKIVYQSHILRFKVVDKARMNPYLLLSLLSSPIVRKQIAARRFTQDIIDTLGTRWSELILPIPKDEKCLNAIIDSAKNAMVLRAQALCESKKAINLVESMTTEEAKNDTFSVINI